MGCLILGVYLRVGLPSGMALEEGEAMMEGQVVLGKWEDWEMKGCVSHGKHINAVKAFEVNI